MSSERLEWYLLKTISKGKEDKFSTLELSKSDLHEQQVPFFKDMIEGMDIEVFEIRGHQFITSDGVYLIANNKEIEIIKE